MLKKVMINVKTERSAHGVSLFDSEDAILAHWDDVGGGDATEDMSDEPEISQMAIEGKLKIALGKVELKYTETELSGMEGSVAVISFSENEPGLVTILRSGIVNTALVFEAGKRHLCAYNTPFMPFEVCVHTLKIDNRLLDTGRLYIDYVVEIRGADPERCKMSISIKEINKIRIPCE
jgi:uncharacterized beta-barrel protein YwiB (DUF1934 family)